MPIVGAETIANSVTANDQTDPAVAVLTGGRYVVTWSSADSGDGSGTLIRARIFNADGSAVGTDLQVNSTATGNQGIPCVTALANGSFVVCWYSEDTGEGSFSCLRARVFDANGNPAGNDFVVNSTAGGFETNPSIALLSDGRFAIVWESIDATSDGSGNCIRCRLFNADGTPAPSAEVFGASTDFVINGTATNNQSNPSIIGLPDGRFVVAWSSQDTSDGSASCIRGRVFNGNGSNGGTDFIIDSSVTGDQSNPVLTVLADNTFLATWYSGDGGDFSSHVIRARKFSFSGVAIGNDVVINSSHVDSQINPSATALPDGGYVLTWQSSDGGDGSGTAIRARIFNAFGDPVGADFIVNSTPDGNQSSPAIATLANGNVVLTWQSADSGDGSGTTIRTITLNTGQVGLTVTGTSSAESVTGSPFGDNLAALGGDDVIYSGAGRDVVDGGDGNDTLVLSGASSDFRIVDYGGEIYSVIDLRQGHPQGIDLVQAVEQVQFSNTQGAIGSFVTSGNGSPHAVRPDILTNTSTTSEQLESAVAALSNGNHIVVWASDDGNGAGYFIRGRIFDPDGLPTGNDFLLPSTHGGSGGNNQHEPVVASLLNGNFVAAWWSNDGGDGSGTMIRARLFDSSGTPLALDFQINSTTSDDQFSPEITVLTDGHFVVTWYSADAVGGDGDSYSIRARIFNPDGSAVGPDFLVNTTTTSYQWQSDVSALAGGQFVVVWQSNDGGDGSGDMIRGRIFTSTGAPVTVSDFQINSTTSSDQGYPSVATLTNGKFVVTWHSDDNGDFSGACIRGRILNSDGTPVANDFVIDTTTTNGQYFSKVEALPNGQFFVTWRSMDTGDGDGWCIRGRLYDANGAAVGNDFIINTATAGNPDFPSVAALADGHQFVVSWHSYDGAFFLREIHSRVYSFNNDPAAHADTLSVLENGTLNSNLVIGTSGATADTDANNDTLAVYAVSGVSGTFWAPGTSIQGTYGTFTLSGNGNLQYVANRPAAEALPAGALVYDSFTYGVTDDHGGASNPFTTVIVNVTGVNDAPVNTSSTTASVAENTVGTIYSATADDIDTPAGSITFAITGGDDALRFVLDTSGHLSFASAPDFEAPSDADHDNVYTVEITASDGIDLSAPVLASVTVTNVSGGNFVGDDDDNTLIGSSEGDTIQGLGGNDILTGGGGADALDGGTGSDTASYQLAGSGITARLDLAFGQDDGGAFDTFVSIENVTGSDFADVIVGKAGEVNVLTGGIGNDTFLGEGIDSIDGGDGNDVLFGGQSFAGLNLNLATDHIETVWGSFVADIMDGSTATTNLTLIGQGLTGGADADTMTGGSGDDFIYFRAGDVINGGTGSDWAVATLSASGATLNMTSAGFENAWGSTSGDTITATGSATAAVIVGDAGNDILTGGSAGDFLYGFGDSDTLTGGGGNDNLVGGAGTDTFAFGANWGTDIVWDWANGSEQFNMQGSGATGFGDLSVNQNYFGSGNALITFGGNRILVVGGANQITSDDFLF